MPRNRANWAARALAAFWAIERWVWAGALRAPFWRPRLHEDEAGAFFRRAGWGRRGALGRAAPEERARGWIWP